MTSVVSRRVDRSIDRINQSIGYSARAIVDAETRAPCPLGRNSRICFASGSPSRSIGSSRADEVARASDERVGSIRSFSAAASERREARGESDASPGSCGESNVVTSNLKYGVGARGAVGVGEGRVEETLSAEPTSERRPSRRGADTGKARRSRRGWSCTRWH